MRRVRVLVSGRVQGVFYRAQCAGRARELGLSGFVRNVPDGRVEAEFEGPEPDVESMLTWCRRGTDWSRVDRVEVEELPLRGEGEFRVR